MNSFIKSIIIESINKSGYPVPVGFDVSEPPNKDFGDYATNVAILISRNCGKTPQTCARELISNIDSKFVEKAEVAGPGFINIYLTPKIIYSKLSEIISQDNDYGKSKVGEGRKVNIEYISANPTGPVHIGNARGGPIGETISNLLDFCGYQVVRSFYVNDIGGQINKLAESFYYWYLLEIGRDAIFPEGGYPGDYVKDAASRVSKEYKKELSVISEKEDFIEFFKDHGVKEMIQLIQKDASLLGIKYDEFIYQSELENNKKTEEIINILKDRGATLDREGALWFKYDGETENDGDNVLRKSDGLATYTYFADDIACHKYKIDQGADLMIDIWGANHHGHVSRMKAAMQSIGVDSNKLKIILYQNVRVKNGEEIIKMSKREGNFILLSDVIKYGVGADAFKYYVLAQNNNTPIDFDVHLAKDKSDKNPVYYIQYAHARICSLLKKSNQKKAAFVEAELENLQSEEELRLIKELIKFPDIIEQASSDFQMQIFPRYAYNLASLFHEFYNKHHIIGEDSSLEKSRLLLCYATKIVIKNTLTIMDITAPDKM
jgi:arginyl-tRNA synthetase